MTRPVRAQFEIRGQKLNVEVLAGDKTVQVVANPESNDPATEGAVTREFDRLVEDGGWEGYSFSLNFYEGIHYRRALVGWLRAAYLASFAVLGYRYILKPDLGVVRTQLTDSDSESLTVFSVTVSSAPRSERRIVLVERPAWLRSLAVQMGRHVVFLPGMTPTPDLYDRLAQRGGQTAELQMSGKLVPWPVKPELALDFL